MCYYLSGAVYRGAFANRQPHGFGVMTWENADKYQGYWQAGKQSGYGELYFEDGSYYKGDFLDT